MNRTGPFLLLLVAIASFALTGPVIKWLISRGGEAISPCNVLFVGNLCAGLLTLAIARPRRVVKELKAVPRGGWTSLVTTILMAVGIPMLIFTALASTMVTNVVLLGRLEAVMLTIASLIFFGTPVGRWQVVGLSTIVVGVVALILVTGMGKVALGDWLVVGASVLFGIAAVTSKISLRHISVPTFVCVRNLVSAIIFFILAIILYGFEHFAEAFTPELWRAMVVYAAIIVVGGQLAWYCALALLPSATVANWSNLTPILSIVFAMILVGERPGTAQIVGGVIILVGMFIAGRDRAPVTETTMEKGLAAA